MRPVLLEFHLPLFGQTVFPSYFTLLAVGFALAAFITWREAARIGLDRDVILDTNLWMVFWGMVGSRALHVIADGHLHDYVNLCLDPVRVTATDALVTRCASSAQCGYDYVCDLASATCHPPRDCLAVVEIWRGGLAYYGGFLFAVPFAFWYLRRHEQPILKVSDLASPAIALGLFFGRLGCFLNGCCYGKPTTSLFGYVFPRNSYAWRAQLDAHLIGPAQPACAVHPTQLYEAAGCLLLSALLYYGARPRKRSDGEVFAWFLIGYAIVRSLIEVLRDDERGVFLGGLVSTSQLISIPLCAAGLALLIVLARRREVSERLHSIT